ncbi:MAG: helix-turn-helix transcriptional regulator [Lachnospiraceae bacterium]|nr:helix-turn-helix transcriptional regulator [Lachnospiraceae bacterium]
MFPTINLKETGINLRRIMDKRGITPKDIKEFLNIGSIQTVYNWFNGLNMPTVDNLYALSQFLQVPIDKIICGNRKSIMPEPIVIIENPRTRRLYAYYKQLNRLKAA